MSDSASKLATPEVGNGRNRASGVGVGILTITNPKKGLWRDAECLLWALTQEPVRRIGLRPKEVSVFPVGKYRTIDRNPAQATSAEPQVGVSLAVPTGTRLVEWLKRVDVLIVCEAMMPKTFALARSLGTRVILIPNLDMTRTYDGQPVSRWPRRARDLGCEIWAKTPKAREKLARLGAEAELVFWSIPDPVIRERDARPGREDVVFFMNAGMRGWRGRRGVELAISAFLKAKTRRPHIKLLIKSIRPLDRYLPGSPSERSGIEAIVGLVHRPKLEEFWMRADVVLYPTRWDGFGLSLLEGLHRGIPAIATNGWPMSELVEHEHNGLLVNARRMGDTRLAPRWECDTHAMADAMTRFVDDDGLRRRLTCPDPSELVARQHAFVMRVRQLVLREPPPRVVLFRPRSEPAWRRSEEYWKDALEAHGYVVDKGHYDDNGKKVGSVLAAPHDFVLVGKCPTRVVDDIKKATSAPIVLWTHDLVDYTKSRKRWFESVAPMVDLCCLPESGREDRFQALGAKVRTLLPGAKVDGNRGHGNRPLTKPLSGKQTNVVFLGGVRPGERRHRLIEGICVRFPVEIYGGKRKWESVGIPARPAIWSEQAVDVIRKAAVVLSISRHNTIKHYTSNRLFIACGAGGCVLAEEYPGVGDHYPDGIVKTFGTHEQAILWIQKVLEQPQQIRRRKEMAEDWTWRHHTWRDRLAELLRYVKSIPGRLSVCAPQQGLKAGR